jgi:hypothetical protein
MPQGNAELMAKEQILGFKPARRLKEIDDVHRERMQEREHRPRILPDDAIPKPELRTHRAQQALQRMTRAGFRRCLSAGAWS